MVPVTYIFVALFGEGTWANEVTFTAWYRSARSTIEGTAWASRYVLLCEWEGRTTAKLTMNVSIKTSCFRSKTPTESSCRQIEEARSKLLRLSQLRSCTCTSLQVGQFQVFSESVPRKILLLRLLFIPGAARGTRVLQFDKKSGAYHTSFNHQRSTKSPSKSQKCM